MKNGGRIKSSVFMLLLAVLASLFLSACGSGSGTPAPSASKEWTWANGGSVVGLPGTYGAIATPASTNFPGARDNAVGRTDASGNLWLFGGYGYDSAGHSNPLNDLWRYSGGLWTWMSGSNFVDQTGTYGTLGTAAPTNAPGARWGALSWIDAAGNFWLFGGYGYDASGAGTNILNDLWQYSAATGQWTWMGGSNTRGQTGTYGTLGTPAPGNIPGARWGALSWTDAAGNFWLFGGNGAGLPGQLGNLNDLWQYSPAIGQWTWMGGSGLANRAGTYGTLGTSSAGNLPGARFGAVGWSDASGNFWVFGGSGYDSAGANGNLNDLWEYNPATGQWTWMGGSQLHGQAGSYGSQGSPAPANVPGARNGAVGWTDKSGNFWLFGGAGQDSAGNGGWLNDLWEFGAGEWTWVSGSDVAGQSGNYGNPGTPAPGNVPGARTLGIGWTDTSGNLWLFGGFGEDSDGTNGYLNDFWEYKP